jgi:hypothetical protein
MSAWPWQWTLLLLRPALATEIKAPQVRRAWLVRKSVAHQSNINLV